MDKTYNYATALSHAILAGTGFYCLTRCLDSEGHWLNLPVVTFSIIATHSVIGIWRWGNPRHGDKAELPYRFTQILQTLFALPCITGHLWLSSGNREEIAYLHPGLSLIPLAAYFADKLRSDLIDLVLAINVISCAMISYYEENYYGTATAVAFAINRYWIADENAVFDVPAQDFYNYAFCFFTYFAYKSQITKPPPKLKQD